MELAVRLLPEATEFIHSMDEKTREKVFFNIRKTLMGLTGEWFQKMPGQMIYGNFEHYSTGSIFVFLPFGIKETGGKR